jgi:hypothetical protein
LRQFLTKKEWLLTDEPASREADISLLIKFFFQRKIKIIMDLVTGRMCWKRVREVVRVMGGTEEIMIRTAL